MSNVAKLKKQAAELRGITTDAVTTYERVCALDIQFPDPSDRLSKLEPAVR